MFFTPCEHFRIDVDTDSGILVPLADPFTAHFCGTAEILPETVSIISADIAEGPGDEVIFMRDILHRAFVQRMSVGFCAHAARFVAVFFVFVFGKFHRRDCRIVVILAKRLRAD